MTPGMGLVVPFDPAHWNQSDEVEQAVASASSRETEADARLSVPLLDEEALPVSREAVIEAFELLLGREPESEETIRHHRALASRVALGAAIRASEEFRLLSTSVQLRHGIVAVPRGVEEGGAPDMPPEGDCTLLATWRFAQDGNGASLLEDGWSAPETEFCWTVGLRSEMTLPLPAGEFPDGVALSLWMTPFLKAQRLSVEVEGTKLASALVRQSTEFACRIPPDLLAGRDRLRLVLHHPDASRPCDQGSSLDDRMLGVAVERAQFSTLPSDAVAPDDTTLMHAFASLGDNCEFGFVQQRCGVVAGGLLRFSSMPWHRLLHGLTTRFDGFPDRSRMRLELHDTYDGRKEYIIFEDRYGFSSHTGVLRPLGPQEEEELFDREHARVRFLTRMLLDDLAAGETVFVFKRNVVPPEAEVMALWLAIRKLGRCALLWVVPAQPGTPSGTVSMLAEGLFKASIDRLAPYSDAEDLSLACWLRICRRTLQLSRLGGPAVDTATA